MEKFVWIPESPTFTAYYAARNPVALGKIGEGGTEFGTYDPNLAMQFDTRADCQEWCDRWNAQQAAMDIYGGRFEPVEHGFG